MWADLGVIPKNSPPGDWRLMLDLFAPGHRGSPAIANATSSPGTAVSKLGKVSRTACSSVLTRQPLSEKSLARIRPTIVLCWVDNCHGACSICSTGSVVVIVPSHSGIYSRFCSIVTVHGRCFGARSVVIWHMSSCDMPVHALEMFQCPVDIWTNPFELELLKLEWDGALRMWSVDIQIAQSL